MSDVLGVSVSGLRVSQNAIRTTGHNIANANTEGYSRQTTDVNSMGAVPTTTGFMGSGAYTANIERSVNEFINTQLRQDVSLYNEFNAYNEYVLQLDDLFANKTTGLSTGLQSFFSAAQNAADDPTAMASRQLLLSESESLTDRVNNIHSRLMTITDGVNQSIRSAVSTINTISNSIAEINQNIAISSNTIGSEPNDLLDKRDQLLKDLSELVSIQVTTQDNNQVNVSIRGGIPIIVGNTYTELSIGQNEFNPLEPEVLIEGSSAPITHLLNGGQVGGLLDFKREVLEGNINSLGRISLALADDINRLQQQGVTLNGEFGNNLFADINNAQAADDRVTPSTQNVTTDQQINLTITDVSQLTTNDYRLTINGTATRYQITRLPDNSEVTSGAMPGALPASIEFSGMSINLDGGTFSAGDEFILEPTKYGARDIDTLSILPEDIALGSPIATSTGTGNQGSGIISQGEVLQIVDSSGNILPTFANSEQLSPPLLIKFTTDTTYDILDNSNPGNPTQLNPPIRNQVYVPGIENQLFSDDVDGTTIVSNGANLGLPAANTSANGYPAETYTFTTTDPSTGSTTTQNLTTILNDSARATASALDNLDGVSANAFNYLELRDFTVTRNVPLQVSLNGEDLVAYDSGALHADVPDPSVNSGEDFNDYLVEQINANENLSNLGIYAVSAYDATNNEYYVQIHSTQGDDLTVGLEAGIGEVIEVNDGNNGDIAITGAGAGTTNTLVVGGSIDINLDADITMSSTPSTSAIFGDTTAANFAGDSFRGIQGSITGTPQAGDNFSIDYNSNAAMDNRNGIAMANLQQENRLVNGAQSYQESYDGMIETVGIKAKSSTIDTEAAKSVLAQSEDLRNSVSGVNLDEEAADLIRYEQLYMANSQVINVARELFDRLINSL